MPLFPTLSMHQPWATLAVLGIKDIENRSWPLPDKYRNIPILIQATRKKMVHDAATLNILLTANIDPSILSEKWEQGGIIGKVTFSNCTADSKSPWALPGFYHWKMTSPQRLLFLKCPGKQRFFKVNYDFLQGES